jgi:hypothetical protein
MITPAMDSVRYYGSIFLKRYLIGNLMKGFAVSAVFHMIVVPLGYLSWFALFKDEVLETKERVIPIQIAPKIVQPKLKPPEPARATAGLTGRKGGGAPAMAMIQKPALSQRIQPITLSDLTVSDKLSVNTEPIPRNPVPNYPNMIARPVADPIFDSDIDFRQQGLGGGALAGPKLHGGSDVMDPSLTAYHGPAGGPPGTAINGSLGADIGRSGDGSGGYGTGIGGGVGGAGDGTGAGYEGRGSGSGPGGLGRAADGDYVSSAGSGGTGTSGIADGPAPISKEELAGLMEWLKRQTVDFPSVVRAYLETKDSDLCGITQNRGWDIYVQFSPVAHQLKIFVTQGQQGILLADSDFKQRSQYFAMGSVSREGNNVISAIQAIRDKPTAQNTEQFYRVFGDWMSGQGISLRASR